MNHNRIMIAGTNSGCGKTTITCALIKALKNQDTDVVSFKTGPDYVDPMFHNVILNSSCRNLDMFFCEDESIRHLINKNANKDTIAIIEGVMGFFDGLGGTSTKASSYDLARITNTPTILVVNAKGISVSLNAMIKGFLEYKDNNIVGVILNNISPMFYQTIKPVIEEECNIEVLGYLSYDKKLELNHRHLGLLMPNEINDIEEKMDLLANKVSETVDLKRIKQLACNAGQLDESFIYPDFYQDVTIGIAKDEAFCFYYEDNLRLLEKFGAKLKYFSTLKDNQIPEDIDALIIGGGYPELFAKELSENTTMINSIKQASANKMPIFAEGGGFVYLSNSLELDNSIYRMCDIIDCRTQLTDKLQPFGYITNESLDNNIMLEKGMSARAHEFHYIKSDCDYNALHARKPLSKRNWKTGFVSENIFAGFSHYHFYANINMPISLIKEAFKYQKRRGLK